MAIKPIQILINAKDNASSVFSSLQARVAAVGAAIAGFFSIRAFSGAVQGAAELQAKLAEVQAVSGATADELVALRAAAESAGATTKFTATEAADALGNLARSGLDANSAIAALPSTLALAQAGSLSLADSSSIMTRALAGFGLEAAEAGRVADVLAKGANSANTTVTGLGQALSFAAPTAVSLGLSLEDTVAIIGKFADAGIDAGRAGTALNSILAQFSDPASKFRKELAAAGITTGDFNKALGQLGNAGPAGQKAILAVGQEAGPALRALLNQGIGSLDELRTALLGAEGAAAATAATMENNLQGASRGLASAWDTVKNALATPVLPVLQQGVTQLAEALRKAVADGAVGRFGEAIAKGFQSALEAFRAFISQVDFEAIGQRLQEFVESAGRSFGTLTEYATNAGNSVKLAYGVMSAGVNTVKAAILGIGSVFAEVASTIMSGVAILREGLAKVSFGGLSAGFKEAAEDARISAGAFGASAQAMRDAADKALIQVAEGAKTARDAWTGLTAAIDETAKSSIDAATGLGEIAKQLEAQADANAKARAASEKAAEVQREQAVAATAAAEAQRALKKEYQEAINTGNIQRAVEVLQQLEREAQSAGTSARDNARAQEAAAQAIADAFQSAGIQTKEALQTIAQNALEDFVKIKASGQATADGLAIAWKRAADAAIAAADGVVPAWVSAQASAQGYEVSVDDAGKSALRLKEVMDQVGQSTDRAGQSAKAAAGGYRNMAQSAGDAAAAAAELAEINRRYSRPGESSTQQGNERNYDPGRNMYGRAGQNDQPVNGNGQTQAEFQRAERLAGQNAVDNTLIFALREKLNAGTLSPADARDLTNAIAALDQNEQVNRDLDRLNPAAFSLEGAADRNEWRAVRQQFQQALTRTAVGKTVRIDLNMNGRSYGPADMDEASAANVETFLRDLERARRSSG